MADKVTITLNQLAASLAEEHELTKRAGRELLDNLVGLITNHLKKGERIRIAGLGRLENEPPEWGGILRLAKRFRLRPARKSLSEHPKN